MAVDVETRALQSGGTSLDSVYRMVANSVISHGAGGGSLIDVGCGAGNLWQFVERHFMRYIGVDIVRYDGFPSSGVFHRIDLDSGRADLPDGCGDVVAGVETIEHLENPRAFARELTRLCRPGGWMIITTPNQLSFLSKLTLLVKNEFNAFRAGSYPAHLTALLEVDLRRIADECDWTEVAVHFSGHGRIPGTPWHYPSWVSRMALRGFSDNILIMGRKAEQGQL